MISTNEKKALVLYECHPDAFRTIYKVKAALYMRWAIRKELSTPWHRSWTGIYCNNLSFTDEKQTG